MHVTREYHQNELWRKKYPTVIGALLAVFEMILTVVIVGCEIGGMLVDFSRMNIFVGYWTGCFFMMAWISLAGASCCCRVRCCGITALVFQVLAIPMALCVIGFDAYFLNNPLLCFFSTCTASGYFYSAGWGNRDTLYSIKVPLTKGQLAAGVLMLVSCLTYIFTFALTSYRVARADQSRTIPPVSVPFPSYSDQHVSSHVNPSFATSSSGLPVEQSYDPPVFTVSYNGHVETPTSSTAPGNQMVCPNCKTKFPVAPP